MISLKVSTLQTKGYGKIYFMDWTLYLKSLQLCPDKTDTEPLSSLRLLLRLPHPHPHPHPHLHLLPLLPLLPLPLLDFLWHLP